jgi:hypothetical protein
MHGAAHAGQQIGTAFGMHATEKENDRDAELGRDQQ